MGKEVLMPKLGMTMTEGTIVQWFKKTGEPVREGETLVEVLTDKVNMEVEAPAEGQIIALLAKEGDIVAVNTPIAYIGQPGERYEAAFAVPPPSASAAGGLPAAEAADRPGSSPGLEGRIKATPAARRAAQEEGIDLKAVPVPEDSDALREKDVRAFRATPLAKKMALASGIELAQIAGTGPNGKVTKTDVETHVGKPPLQPPAKRERLAGLRRVIAQKMSAAWAAPHVTLHTEVLMSGLIDFYKKAAPSIETRTGVAPTYNDLILKITARALSDNPDMNARLVDDHMEYCADINVGMAIGLPGGLIVPVLRNADRLSLEQLARQTRDLVQRAREGKLLPDEMSGGTFTVTNLGMFGVDHFTPILNSPEIGILGVGRIMEKPVVVKGEIVAQPVMSLSLSFDHRAVDGVLAAQLLKRIKELCEDHWQLL